MIREAKPVELVRAGMAWEVIEPGPPRFEPWVGINIERGCITLPMPVFELMGTPKAVMVLFSKEHASIGLSPCDLNEKDSFYISDKRSAKRPGNPKQIRSKKLGRMMASMDFKGAYRLPVHWEPSGILWGDLSNLRRAGRPSASRPPHSAKPSTSRRRADARPVQAELQAMDSTEISR